MEEAHRLSLHSSENIYTAIVQARMSSSRLPGKVMKEVKGETILGYLLKRLKKSQCLKQVIVATSIDSSDAVIQQFCAKHDVVCYQGPLQDVAKRFQEVIRFYRLKTFVRLNGDSPLMDAQLIDEMIAVFEEGKYQIVTNTFQRSFPKGQSIEIFDGEVFLENYPKMSRPEHFEHVTQYFYQNPKGFKILNYTCSLGDYSKFNLCIDTQEDFDRFKEMVGLMERPAEDYRWQECLYLQERILTRP